MHRRAHLLMTERRSPCEDRPVQLQRFIASLAPARGGAGASGAVSGPRR